MMLVRLKVKAGHRGAKQLTEEYGDQLVCVRYRYDEATKKTIQDHRINR